MNKFVILAIFCVISGCFMGNPVDYFDKMAECMKNHPKHQDVCLEVDKQARGYPLEIDFEIEYQKILKERSDLQSSLEK